MRRKKQRSPWSSVQPGDPWYALGLAAVNRAVYDGLKGDPGALLWLFSPISFEVLSRLLGNASCDVTALAATKVMSRCFELIASGEADDVRRALAYRRKERLREVFNEAK